MLNKKVNMSKAMLSKWLLQFEYIVQNECLNVTCYTELHNPNLFL